MASSRINFFKLTLFTLSIILLPIFGCDNHPNLKGLDEGYIEYNIEYYDCDSMKFTSKMRPSSMVVKFKDNNTINKIEGLSGTFAFSFIQDIELQKTFTLIKFLNKFLVYEEPINDTLFPFAYEGMPKFSIENTNETEVYLGLNCNKARAKFNDSIWYPFEILYTNELSIENPNFNTPFEEIEGVMLRFSVILFDQKMKIQATNIKAAKIPYDEFLVPKYYEKIEKETVIDIIDLLK